MEAIADTITNTIGFGQIAGENLANKAGGTVNDQVELAGDIGIRAPAGKKPMRPILSAT